MGPGPLVYNTTYIRYRNIILLRNRRKTTSDFMEPTNFFYIIFCKFVRSICRTFWCFLLKHNNGMNLVLAVGRPFEIT